MNITRTKFNNLMIRGREKRRSKIYKYFMESNRMREFRSVRQEFLKALNLVNFY